MCILSLCGFYIATRVQCFIVSVALGRSSYYVYHDEITIGNSLFIIYNFLKYIFTKKYFNISKLFCYKYT